ncbi:MAG: lipid-A-disaccharide synthase [Bacteroidales bacterium]|nr:lipid-A-disaccharide synthase [Bacteroidales bacterium]
MKYYIVAGEASGDLHGSNLMKALKERDGEADFRFWGGDLMQSVGGELIKHYKEMAFMGFFEVATHLRQVLNNIKVCEVDILLYEPDVLILIDYPGFNLRIAEFAHEHGIKVIYYISPQVWAWKKNRIHKIKRCVDEMIVILPFEKEFYEKHQVPVHFVGHPLLDAIDKDIRKSEAVTDFRQRNNLDEREIVAILPGSRKQEIDKMLPVMLEVATQYPQYQFIVSGVNWQPQTLYEKYLKKTNIKIVYDQTYPLLLNAKSALVTSGTATLETALLGTPQVVCYKGSAISYIIAKHLIKGISYISLVNLILDKPAVVELIQYDMNAKRLSEEFEKITFDEQNIQRMKADYANLHHLLADSHASANAAEVITKFTKSQNS